MEACTQDYRGKHIWRRVHLKTISKRNISQIDLCSMENEPEPQKSDKQSSLQRSRSLIIIESDELHFRGAFALIVINQSLQLSAMDDCFQMFTELLEYISALTEGIGEHSPLAGHCVCQRVRQDEGAPGLPLLLCAL